MGTPGPRDMGFSSAKGSCLLPCSHKNALGRKGRMGWQPDDAGPSGDSPSPVLWGCLGPGTWECACSNTEPGLTRLEKSLESPPRSLLRRCQQHRGTQARISPEIKEGTNTGMLSSVLDLSPAHTELPQKKSISINGNARFTSGQKLFSPDPSPQ